MKAIQKSGYGEFDGSGQPETNSIGRSMFITLNIEAAYDHGSELGGNGEIELIVQSAAIGERRTSTSVQYAYPHVTGHPYPRVKVQKGSCYAIAHPGENYYWKVTGKSITWTMSAVSLLPD